jgi:hypothetical protein
MRRSLPYLSACSLHFPSHSLHRSVSIPFTLAMRIIYIQGEDHLNTLLKLSLCGFIDHGAEGAAPSYAILSHLWCEEEALFANMSSDSTTDGEKKGYNNLEASCSITLRHDLQHIWYDTCCTRNVPGLPFPTKVEVVTARNNGH